MFNIQTATNELGFLCTAYSVEESQNNLKLYYFKNGFGCSVIDSRHANCYEIGLLKGHKLCYIDNHKFWNTIDGLEHKQVLEILKEVSEMPDSNTVKTSDSIGEI